MHRAPSSSSSCSHEVYTAEPKQVNGGGSILSFRHLSYAVNTKRGQKMLIDEVSVDVYAGQLLAIMVFPPQQVMIFGDDNHSSSLLLLGTLGSR